MKFKITFGNEGLLDSEIREAHAFNDVAPFTLADETAVRKLANRFIGTSFDMKGGGPCRDFITIELDTDAGTCTVLPAP